MFVQLSSVSVRKKLPFMTYHVEEGMLMTSLHLVPWHELQVSFYHRPNFSGSLNVQSNAVIKTGKASADLPYCPRISDIL